MDKLFWRFGQETGWGQQQPGAVGLPAGGTHVWFFSNARDFQYEGVVADAERTRAENMLPAAKGQEFLSFRACLRIVLALYYIKTIAPKNIRMEISEKGKPWLPDAPKLHFNLSHSHGALAIAVSRHEVGVDIEKIRPIPDWQDLAQNFLAPTVATTIANHAEAERSTAFLRCFTAREAHLKALGTGFSAPLPGMDFHSSYREQFTTDGKECLLAPLPQLPGFVGHVCILNRDIA
ncbi:MAG: 4'-phosphopantetheinyl transferase family protein [Spirochaetota bacterium]